jgi:AcrR family transcriptional regulator
VRSTGQQTRSEILRVSARLFAERGYGGTSVEDIGGACGISGPAVYKHFANKHAVLADLLVDISEQLQQRALAVLDRQEPPAAALRQLVEVHVDFALAEPDLIRVHDRDLPSLQPRERRTVRRLQRGYVELWVDVLRALDPGLSTEVARTRAHATFGLLNSTPHSARAAAVARAELVAMALRALDAPAG